MTEEEDYALASIQFSSVLGADEIWSPLSHHVDGLHPHALAALTRAVRTAAARPCSTPTGLVLSGEKGVGKTHMLGWLRQHVQEQGGAFFMPKLIDGASFWSGAVHGAVNRLLGSDGGQLGSMLYKLAELAGCDSALGLRVRGIMSIQPPDLRAFLDLVESVDLQVAQECQDTLRALVLYQNREHREIGHAFLALEDGLEESARSEWGFRERVKPPQLVFRELIRLFALTGPVVLAIDQIDTVIAQSARTDGDGLADRLADGLMSLREETVRTLVVVACIPTSWELIATRAVNSASDRFTVLELATAMPDSAVASAIVERHLGGLYGEIGFVPPYPTWPVLPVAFDDPAVAAFTPRRLLQRLDAHVRTCLAQGRVDELTHFEQESGDSPPPAPATPADAAALDERFEALRAAADIAAPLDPAYADERMVALLNAGLRAYVHEQNRQDMTVDPATSVQPALHARLRRTLDEGTEDEEHWCFRAVAHPHHRAVQARLRSAMLESGIQPGVDGRHLVILRNAPFSSGRVTVQMLEALESANGRALPAQAEDLRTFGALETMLAEHTPGLINWLVTRKHASRTELFSRVLSDATVAPTSGRDHAISGHAELASDQAASESSALHMMPVPGMQHDDEPLVDELHPPRNSATAAAEPASAPPNAVVPPRATSADVSRRDSVDAYVWAVPSNRAEAPATGSTERTPARPTPGAGPGSRPVPTAPSSTRTSAVLTTGSAYSLQPDGMSVSASNEMMPQASGDQATEPAITLGRYVGTGREFRVPLVLLRKHVAVFAGSGSGKTVLLRRLVEEAALQGISSILIDTNNDLARLGDRWTGQPPGWSVDDSARAERYFADTDVVVWTPRREAGRPLSLNPLPDFSGVLSDPDEFRIAVDASVAGLLQRAGLTVRKRTTGQAVLTQALSFFARRAGCDLDEFVALLGDLPDEVSTLRDAHQLAAAMATELTAAMINDPVFGGAGARLDPGALLTPAPGKRARVSVISCIGLPTSEQQQTFVNQLQLALFAWIKRNPAGDRPLGGLLVLDEAHTFVPSRQLTASSESSLHLAAQARKYGLGLVFATQAPKALHNMVTGNTATQFFGRLNAPAHMQAATELARSKGGNVDDISRLPAGRFYGATEGASFGKLAVPMCLSHHPPSALTEEEVIRRARGEYT